MIDETTKFNRAKGYYNRVALAGNTDGAFKELVAFNKQADALITDNIRPGFYRGESVVKSHGQKIIELGEAGESSVSIAKKLGLKQQTVNNAINAIEKGLAGNEYKFSKPFKEIIKLSVNQHGAKLNEADKQAVEKLIKDDPEKYFNQKETTKFLGRKRAELVPADEYPKPGKVWNDEAEKLRNEADKAWTKKYSSISIEDKTRGDMNINRHHAGSLREKVGTDNTMFMDAQDNYKNIRPFEKAIDEIQLKQYQTNLNRNMTIETKKEIFDDLKKQEDALRKKYPEFSDYKSTLIFDESALSKTGFKYKEEMPNPELTVSEGKTGQNIKYKDVKPSSEDGKKIIELNKKQFDLIKNLNTVSNQGGAKGKAAAKILAILAGSTGGAAADDGSDGTSGMLIDAGIGGGAVATLGTKTGRKILMNLLNASGLPASAAFNIIYGIDPSSSLDRGILGFELAISPVMVRDALGVTNKIQNQTLKKIAQAATTISPKYAMKAARIANPIGLSMVGGEIAHKVMTESEPNYYIGKDGEPTFYDRENASDVFPSMIDANEQAYKIAKEKNISYEDALREIDMTRLVNLKNE